MLLDANLVLPHSPLAPVALAIMASVLLVAALQLLPIHVAGFLGVIAMLVTGCVRFEGIGRALSLEVVLLIASSVALGQSLVATGAAGWVAEGIAARRAASATRGADRRLHGVRGGADELRVERRGRRRRHADRDCDGHQLGPAARAVRARDPVRRELELCDPMAYQTNLLIMNAAGYRFSDFVEVGGPLVALMLVVLSMLLANRYGL